MRKLFLTILFIIVLSENVFAEIIFRAECENPKGIRFSEDILHMQDNKKSLVDFEEDKFSGSDKIELIYDTNKKDQIQFIWGTENKFEKLYAHNSNFYHWGFVDNNYGNGFYWGHWSFSLPNKILTYYKGNTSSTGLSTGIATSLFKSKCILK
jgi:hypothetical protein